MSLSSDMYDVAYLEMVDELTVAPIGAILVVEPKEDVADGQAVWCKRADNRWMMWSEAYTDIAVLQSTIGYNYCLGAWSLS